MITSPARKPERRAALLPSLLGFAGPRRRLFEAVLGLAVVVFYDAEPDDLVLMIVAGAVAAIGVAAAGSSGQSCLG